MGIHDVVKVPTDDRHRMDVATLAALLDGVEEPARQNVATPRGREAGFANRRCRPCRPLAVVATAGSTATGSFDDLQAIADLCERHDTWLHVDAAHGASVLLAPSLRHLAGGLDRADSLSWDPHKMMWMPLSLGAILVRDGVWLRRAFEADAPYLFHGSGNLGEMTIQCSKRADAVKLWLTLQIAGTEPIVRALEHVTAMTRYLFELVVASDDFEAMHEPEFNIFCFRARGAGGGAQEDERNARIREAVIRGGEAWITSTILKGRRVLRVTMINPRTERAHVERMLEAVRRAGR
jgi:L-2,4-diaminobutyrate decarboxylase